MNGADNAHVPMPMRPTPLLAALLVLSSPAFAESIRRNLAQAGDRIERAMEDNTRASANCHNRADPGLTQALDAIDGLKMSDDPTRFDAAAQQFAGALNMAKLSGCPEDFTRDLQKALSDLMDAASDIRRRRPSGPPPPPAGPGISFAGATVQQSAQGATVVVPTVNINGMQNSSVYYAWHWKAENGNWGAWESLPAVQINGSQFVWNNPYRALIDYGTLRQQDSGSGRFVVHGGIFDMNGRELQGVDLQFTAQYPQAQPPPPPPQPAARDCGLGADDPGCSMTRGGPMPMERPAYEGFMRSLRANLSESARGAMVRDTCRVQWLTARQLGAIMDLFIGENNRLDAVRNCAPHVVDPSNALGFGTKFLSSSRQREFNQVISSQR